MGCKIALVVSVISLISAVIHAEEVIDLGTLQVEGEVRRPPVEFYVARKVPPIILERVAENSFADLEDELLSEAEPNFQGRVEKLKKKEKKP